MQPGVGGTGPLVCQTQYPCTKVKHHSGPGQENTNNVMQIASTMGDYWLLGLAGQLVWPCRHHGPKLAPTRRGHVWQHLKPSPPCPQYLAHNYVFSSDLGREQTSCAPSNAWHRIIFSLQRLFAYLTNLSLISETEWASLLSPSPMMLHNSHSAIAVLFKSQFFH